MTRDELRASRDALEVIIREAGGLPNEVGEMRCPYHDDKCASAGIFEHEGVWWFRCHGCGLFGDIFTMTERTKGISVVDQLKGLSTSSSHIGKKPAPQHTVYPTIEALEKSVVGHSATYKYVNPETKAIDLIILRHSGTDGSKSYKNARPAEGGFIKEAPPKPWPLYNRGRIRKAGTIVVVEGEKCVHAIQDVLEKDSTIAPTTAPGGAGKAHYASWEPLAGKKVILWPDNDKPGISHMKGVEEELRKLKNPPTEIRWLDPKDLGLPAKGDAYDYLDLAKSSTGALGASGSDSERRVALESALALSSLLGPSDGLGDLIEDTISGRRRAIPWPWKTLTALSKDLLNGSTVAVCGEPGSSKTFFVLECAAYWHSAGVKVALFELEDEKELYLLRMLAQIENNANQADDAWIRANPEASRNAYNKHKAFLDSMARLITVPNDEVDHAYVLNWAKQQIRNGAEILIIDPVTAIGGSTKDTSDNDRKFVKSLNQLGKESGTRSLLVTHPKKLKPGQQVTLDDMAGGTAYARFTHGVFWIKRHELKEEKIIGPYGTTTVCSIDRTLSLFKGRNGKGTGSDIGFCFDKNSLRFAEAGVISKKGGSGSSGSTPVVDPFEASVTPSDIDDDPPF